VPELLTKDQQRLADQAKTFAETHLLRLDSKLSSETRARIISAAREVGFFAMTQPKEYGGSAAGALEMTVVRDSLGACNAPHQHLLFGPGPGVLAGADGALRDSHLAPLLRGEKRSGFGFTEPDDASAPTSAVADGNFWVVNGQKSYVTGGSEADFINTLVQIPELGPALLVVDTDASGVSLTRRFESLDGSHHAAFAFSDVRVPMNHLIGKPGEGLPRAMRQIGDTRLAIAAQCVGLLRWVDGYLSEYLLGNDRSGTPRGSKEGIRLRYADARISSFAVRSMVYRTARLADAGENIVNEAIACKVMATETIGSVVDNAIQLVGGNALVAGHPLERLYRQVRALRLAEGGSDVLRLNLARGRLELNKGRI
jgi:alkylation response protein AidB-like acyl-CoA dehydrogenase